MCKAYGAGLFCSCSVYTTTTTPSEIHTSSRFQCKGLFFFQSLPSHCMRCWMRLHLAHTAQVLGNNILFIFFFTAYSAGWLAVCAYAYSINYNYRIWVTGIKIQNCLCVICERVRACLKLEVFGFNFDLMSNDWVTSSFYKQTNT